jgi:hypothetical protein
MTYRREYENFTHLPGESIGAEVHGGCEQHEGQCGRAPVR